MPAKKPAKKPASKKRWIVIGRHDQTSGPNWAKCADTYEQALAYAGEFWKSYDGVFDPKKKPYFFAGEGYDPNVEVSLYRGKVSFVVHAEGQGACIDIQPES